MTPITHISRGGFEDLVRPFQLSVLLAELEQSVKVRISDLVLEQAPRLGARLASQPHPVAFPGELPVDRGRQDPSQQLRLGIAQVDLALGAQQGHQDRHERRP